MSELALKAAEALEGPSSPGDQALLAECRSGDPEAFARLVALHERMVFNLAARLLGDAEEARDMAQDVFLQIHHTLDRFQGRSSLRTWIYRIVVNRCANRRRSWYRRRRSLSLPLEALPRRDEAVLASSGDDSPETRCAQREQAEHVQRALALLSFEHRTVLLLRETEELSCDEIAHALRIPAGTVKSRLSRARDALRQAMVRAEGGAA